MKRTGERAALLFAGALLGAAGAAAGDGTQRQNLSTAAQPAYEALSAGRQAMSQGELERAEEELEKVLDFSQRGSKQYQAAVEALTFELPFLRAEGFVDTGEWLKAERLLEDLLRRSQNDVKKTERLAQLIAVLRENARAATAARRPGRAALGYVEEKLDQFRGETGRYPADYEELEALLEADGSPLEDYEIVDYVARGGAYGVTLRGKSNPDHVLTVQRTGRVR